MRDPRRTRLPLAALLLALLAVGGTLVAAGGITRFPVAARGLGAVLLVLALVLGALVAGGPLSAPRSEGA